MTDVTPVEGRAQSGGAQLLGCLGGAVGFAAFVLFFAASCTEDREADGSIVVADGGSMLSDAGQAAIERLRFPAGTPVVVRTIGSLPPDEIGSYATDRMPEEPYWQDLRPRGFLRRYLRQDPAWAPGVYVLVSAEPRLVQIRFGHEIRLAAYQEKLAAGDWYRRQQEFAEGDLDRHLLETLRDLSARMESVVDPPWPMSWARALSSLVASEIEDFLAPSDGWYSHAVLANYVRAADAFGGTGSATRFLVFGLVSFVALWLVGKKLLIQRLLLRVVGSGWLRWVLVAVANIGLLGVLVTGFAALAVLSRGRVEDELALQALGLSFLADLGFESTAFSVGGGWLLAIPGAIVGLIGDIRQSVLASEQARLEGNTYAQIPVQWLGWACALYLLPRAIAIPALVVLTWGTGATIFGAPPRTS